MFKPVQIKLIKESFDNALRDLATIGLLGKKFKTPNGTVLIKEKELIYKVRIK